MRILLIKRDKLGDLLLTRPSITHLVNALPGAEVHLLANDYNAWVAREHPGTRCCTAKMILELSETRSEGGAGWS